MLLYGTYKLTVLHSRSEYTVNKAIQEFHFVVEDVYDTSEGFKVAAAFTAYDGNPEPIEDPRYGTIEFYHKWWNETGFDFAKQPSGLCSD